LNGTPDKSSGQLGLKLWLLPAATLPEYC